MTDTAAQTIEELRDRISRALDTMPTGSLHSEKISHILAAIGPIQTVGVEELVDAAVGAWHDEGTLPEWLGWTDDEYATWVADPQAIPRPPKHFARLSTPPQQQGDDR